jgi:replicative superfamily II helicase
MLAQWMNAKFYISTYRPVPIDEYLVYENSIYPAATSRQLFQTASKLAASSLSLRDSIPPYRIIEASSFKELGNSATNSMVALAVETAAAGFGALVFCGSRGACQTHAAVISEAMPLPSPGSDEMSKRVDLIAELRSLACGLDPVLQSIVIKGAGFHRQYHSILL